MRNRRRLFDSTFALSRLLLTYVRKNNEIIRLARLCGKKQST